MAGPPYPPPPPPITVAPSAATDGISPPPSSAIFTGSIAGNVLTVTSVFDGVLAVGQALTDDLGVVLPGTVILKLGTGTGGTGTYTLTGPAQTVPSQTIFAYMLFDYWQTIISQYANSPILTQIIANFFAYVDQTVNLDAFYDLIWNVDTAQGYGLDVWGRIVGVTRTLQVAGAKFLGFDEATSVSADPFNQSPLYSGSQLTSNFNLSDNAFRTLIFAKALANISNGSIPAINQLLLNLFPGRGNCFVTDGGNMTMTYTFKFLLTPVEAAIVSQSGVLPKPVGVLATVVQSP